MTTRHDPGLHAVARVRGVQERASLLALQQALAALQEREDRLTRLREQLSDAATREVDILETGGTPGALLTLRMTLGHLAETTRQARADLTGAQDLADAARHRWEHDRSQLAAVEQLLDRRTAERRHEARRTEDRQTDETAAQGWQRRTQGDHR